MALALRLEQLVRSGAVKDYATLAELGGVSRARISQIMNLIHLAPGIQEALFISAAHPVRPGTGDGWQICSRSRCLPTGPSNGGAGVRCAARGTWTSSNHAARKRDDDRPLSKYDECPSPLGSVSGL